MPNFPDGLSEPVDSLRSYLRSTLPNSRVTDVSPGADSRPLLLLETGHVAAGFAFSNGDMWETYEATYGDFKNYYLGHQKQWGSLDLAFVFCVRPNAPDLEGFCSSIETDVYFCRKFVVPLAPPLSTSLARLPFLPLSPVEGQALRPASAQTFLQQCGVPAAMARDLVVQHKRSPEGIVEDCIAGNFGEPRTPRPSLTASPTPVDRSHDLVRLDTVTIENFRAYRRRRTFTLGSGVTVLYGPNGFGKTSFYDAVDFAMTGDIGRIKTSREPHFRKVARHLDSSSEDSAVELSFLQNGACRKLRRTVDNRKEALLDGQTADRKAVLTELTRGNSPAADRIENFVSLFRATHLFNQEDPELTKNFGDECGLPATIVARMLAFEDYANAVNKASKVQAELQTIIGDTGAQIRQLSQQVAEDQKELDRLGQTAQPYANLEALSADADELRKKLIAAGVNVGSQQLDAAVARGWRASLEARIGRSQNRSTRFSALAMECTRLPQMRANIAALLQQISESEQALSAAEKKRDASRLALDLSIRHLAEREAKLAASQARVEVLGWLRATQPLYAQLLVEQRTGADELDRAVETLTRGRKADEEAAVNSRAQDARSAQVAEQLRHKRAQLAAAQSLKEAMDSWQAKRGRLADVAESERQRTTTLESLRATAAELAPKIDAAKAEEARISGQVAQVEARQSELRTLLSRLRAQVQTGVCPLCGEDHGSKEELLLRIQEHMAADPASDFRNQLRSAREEVALLAEQAAANNQRRSTAEAGLGNLRRERADLEAEIAQLENSLPQFAGIINVPAPMSTEQIQEAQNRLQRETDELNQKIQVASEAASAAREALRKSSALVASAASELDERRATVTRLQEAIKRLVDDPRLRQTEFSFDIGTEPLAGQETVNSEQLSQARTAVVQAQGDTAEKQAEHGDAQQELKKRQTQLSSLREELHKAQESAAHIAAQLEELKLPGDANEATLLGLASEENSTHAQLLTLRDSASVLELALDAATTSAALTQLQQNLRSKERALAAATQKRDQHEPWLRYFDVVSRLVSSQQREAIADFTRTYGPRTSVIQKRLRSVYGFDELEMKSQESTISVRVRRRGEELKPTDYFSQSQQQTLFLGLFLTACISQTWSAFSPVFLDDPVTHFDDLNTYAFLDLIVGLLEPSGVGQQFIISTCDEKLLQLARQKFRYLDKGARFYRFSAIGEEGPVVDEVE